MIRSDWNRRRWAQLCIGLWISILLHMALLGGIIAIRKSPLKVPIIVNPSSATIHDQDHPIYFEPPLSGQEAVQEKTRTSPPSTRDLHRLPLENAESEEGIEKPPSLPIMRASSGFTPIPAPIASSSPSIISIPMPQGESPHPERLSQHPDFALASRNPANQMRDAMLRAAHSSTDNIGSVRSQTTPAISSGVDVQRLTPDQGVDFRDWLIHWHRETENTWRAVVPFEIGREKSGIVVIRFKVLPSGRVIGGSLVLERRSGDTALGRGAWAALTASSYPPLPNDFQGPYVELRAFFNYGLMQQQ